MNKNRSSAILFFDDQYLHRRENLVRHVGRPKLVTAGIFVDPNLDPSWGYPTVFQDSDSGRWRCLYQGQLDDSKYTRPGHRMQHIAAAVESDDGVRWEIPDLTEKVPIPDRARPHQVLPIEGFGEWGPCFYDAHTDNAAQRVKAFVSSSDRQKGSQRHSPLYASPDGLSWKLIEDASWHPYGIDPAVSGFWNSIRESYVIAARPKSGDRRISVYETRDWHSFSEPEVAIRPDAQDTPASEVYGMPVFPYESIFVGFLWIYHVTPVVDNPHKYIHGKVDCQLAYSYNGWHFQRALREQFLPNAEPGDFGYGCIYPSSMVLTQDNKIRIYSSVSKGEHAQIHARPDLREGAILLHELRLDGFSYLEPEGGSGSFTTRPCFFQGENLTLNVQAPQGEVRVQITDPDGKPHQGFTFEDCIPFRGDDLFWQPKWKNNRSVSKFMEKVVRLEVELFNGRIYSIRGDFIPIQNVDYRQFRDQGIPPNPIYER